MKNHQSSFLLILIAILYWTNLKGQDYTPFYLDSAEWIVSTIYPIVGAGDGGAVWKYRTRNDTLINDLVYRNLGRSDLCEYYPDMNGNINYVNNIDLNEYLIGGMREVDKKVYFYNSNEETLLYDFNITIGDTIFYGPDDFTIILEEENPVEGHRSYQVINSNGFAFPYETSGLLEGIGSIYGLFGTYLGHLNDLECFKLSGQPYIFENCDLCEGFITSLNEINQSSAIRLFPNPASHKVTLRTEFGMITQVVFLSHVGKEVLSYRADARELVLDITHKLLKH